jgi:dihydroflavonol-4-reductase
VTGASGFIGGNLVRLLLEHGSEVRVLLRGGSDRGRLEGLDVERVEGDLRDPASLRRAIGGCATVFHVAGLYSYWARDWREFYAANVDGTATLMALALEAGVERVVYTSTMGIIGPSANGTPATEESRSGCGDGDHYTRSCSAPRKLLPRGCHRHGPSAGPIGLGLEPDALGRMLFTPTVDPA